MKVYRILILLDFLRKTHSIIFFLSYEKNIFILFAYGNTLNMRINWNLLLSRAVVDRIKMSNLLFNFFSFFAIESYLTLSAYFKRLECIMSLLENDEMKNKYPIDLLSHTYFQDFLIFLLSLYFRFIFTFLLHFCNAKKLYSC